MADLNISKVAVGCASIDALRKRQLPRVRDGVVTVRTRFKPTRADELVGGSLYWIIKHRIAVRQTILGFAEDGAEKKTIIRLDPELVAVRPSPKRAHQGWRYLAGADAPQDSDGSDDGLSDLPPRMINQLVKLALI